MLIIRDQQRDVFREAARRRFVEEMVAHARASYPPQAEALGGELRATLERALETGRGYGFVTQRDACKFVNLTLDFGADFHRAPEVATVLDDPGITNAIKVMTIRSARPDVTGPAGEVGGV